MIKLILSLIRRRKVNLDRRDAMSDRKLFICFAGAKDSEVLEGVRELIDRAFIETYNEAGDPRLTPEQCQAFVRASAVLTELKADIETYCLEADKAQEKELKTSHDDG